MHRFGREGAAKDAEIEEGLARAPAFIGVKDVFTLRNRKFRYFSVGLPTGNTGFGDEVPEAGGFARFGSSFSNG